MSGFRRIKLRIALLALCCGSNGAALRAENYQPLTLIESTETLSYRFRGRIDADFIWSEQSEKNETDFGQLGDAFGLRRARLGVEGEFSSDGSYVAEIDLASGSVVIRDLYVAQEGEIGRRHAGHFREPFSLEGGTSARYYAFMERSPINVLDPARNWGLALFEIPLLDETLLHGGAFYGSPDQNDLEGGDGSTAGVTAKLTSAPINDAEGTKLLHYGFAIAERLPVNGVILVNEQPRSPLLEFNDSTTSAFVPTIVIPANFQHILNAQLAVGRDAFWTQAEWYGTFIDQSAGGTVFYHGCYVDAGYFLTGEHREYDARSGVLGPIRVQRPFLARHGVGGGSGAWEVVARFAWLDFFDADAPLSASGNASGVQLPQATFGVNWYLSDQLRLMFNYSYAEPSLPATGESSAGIFATRIGYFW